MNKKHPNFQDLFSLKDIKIARDVVSTYDCGISRIALRAPEQTYSLNTWLFKEPESASCLVHYTTLRLKYAEEAIEKSVRAHGGRQFRRDFNPDINANLGKYYISISPGSKYLFFDNATWGIGDAKYIKIEHEDGTEEKIDIFKVEGLNEWRAEYLSAKENKQDLSLFCERGYALARAVSRILPNDTALFYRMYSEEEPVK